MKLHIRPIHLKHANKYVGDYHRHNKPTVGGKFAIACYKGDEIVGVAIGGRPVAQENDNGTTFEIYRVCGWGERNVNSMLISRMKRIAQLMGYQKFQTYTLQKESGASLRAVGAVIDKDVVHTKQWNDSNGVKRSTQAVTVMPKFRWIL